MAGRIRKSAVDRKSEIVNIAIYLAGELGPDRLTSEKLADRIGISQAAIFRHFANKNDIWCAVGERIRDLLIENTDRVSKTDEFKVNKFTSQVIGQLKFIEETPAIPAILFSRELHRENEPLREFFVQLMAERQAYFSKLINQEKLVGKFRANLNVDNSAQLTLSLIQGLAMRWSLNARDFDLVEEGQGLLDTLVDGFIQAN